jgi:hypothetical protein
VKGRENDTVINVDTEVDKGKEREEVTDKEKKARQGEIVDRKKKTRIIRNSRRRKTRKEENIKNLILWLSSRCDNILYNNSEVRSMSSHKKSGNHLQN